MMVSASAVLISTAAKDVIDSSEKTAPVINIAIFFILFSSLIMIVSEFAMYRELSA
jgi:Ni,Fe-hydrogenase I cytochrome b subunit